MQDKWPGWGQKWDLGGWGVGIVREQWGILGPGYGNHDGKCPDMRGKWGTLGLDCENNEGKRPDWGKPENLGFSCKNHKANHNLGTKRSHLDTICCSGAPKPLEL